ncbi:hypothetical protein [Psychrobacillus sp. L3]|uniref:hypothetical protein n=1 Tax=Psychrobacillus sp. L3 TaxID=3236891 RepID=UPI0036F305E5
MSVDLYDADAYLSMHVEKVAWESLSDDMDRKNSLQMAENYINAAFELREDVKEKSIYLYAVCEQAIHLLVFDKERLILQREGVSSYKFEDMSFQMDISFISPIVSTFLKKHSFKKLGKII